MVAPVLTRVRQAIADIAKTTTTVDLEAFAYVPGGEPPFPFAFVELGSTDVTNSPGGQQRMRLNLVVLIGPTIESQAQQDLDSLIAGTGSLTALLKADRTLNGTVDTSNVQATEPLNMQQAAGYNAWGHQWIIDVWFET